MTEPVTISQPNQEPYRQPLPNPLGRHVLVELYDCDDTLIRSLDAVKSALLEITRIMNLTVVEVCFHEYSPHGITGVVVIAESHIAVHTWPEYGYAAVDVFTCGEAVSPTQLQAELHRCFQAEDSCFQVVKRGLLKR